MPRVSRPRDGEPIRLTETASGPRYSAVVDTAPPGAKRRQVRRTFRTLSEARDFVSETRERVARGTFTAPSRVTLAELAEAWLTSRRDVRTATVAGYRSALTGVLDRLGDRPAQTITRPEVDTVMVALETEGGRRGRPLSHRSVQYALVTLRMVLAYGVSSGVLASNPAADVKVRRRRLEDHKVTETWAPAELRAFVAHVDTEPDAWVRVAFRLAACGLRRGEVLGLEWSAVDLEAGTVRVEASRVRTGAGSATERDEAKSAASVRTVHVEAMWPGTVAALRALSAAQAADRLAMGRGYPARVLVVSDRLGRGIHPEVFAQRWRGLREASGLPVIRLHALRHSLALTLHRAGVAPADVASMLGHTVATHLHFYVPASASGAQAAASRLGEVLAAVQ